MINGPQGLMYEQTAKEVNLWSRPVRSGARDALELLGRCTLQLEEVQLAETKRQLA